MLKRVFKTTFILFIFLMLAPAKAATNHGRETQPTVSYYIQRSDVLVPPGVKMGDYQRTIRPFQNGWTLVCDTNFSTKRKICNVTQKIEDNTRKVVFSWSLAAAQNGQPIMIVRVPTGTKGGVYLNVRDSQFPLIIGIEGCTSQVCVGYLPVSNIFRTAIEHGDTIKVEFSVGTPKKDFKIPLSLKGLEEALKSI